MQKLYAHIMRLGTFALKSTLKKRMKKGKEDPERIHERMGKYKKERPEGPMAWVHAASVGEAQSALILIVTILDAYQDTHILVTTGTVTSASLMEQRLPARAFHQYYPLDHPGWVSDFLGHWKPDTILWLESELWPNMLTEIRSRDIPCALVNAKLSEKSLKNWKIAPKQAKKILSAFQLILTQTQNDADHYAQLGATQAHVTGNLKYSAAPLPYDEKERTRIENAVENRPLWLYASTHDGEEDIACRIHKHLSKSIDSLLTIIVPRHPERRKQIEPLGEKYGVTMKFRGGAKQLPGDDTDVYVADTIGELGLFYRLSPIACIGRSLSNDGGGGHNPIEAAQLDCAILYGHKIQNLAEIYAEFDDASAALCVKNETELQTRIEKLLTDTEGCHVLQNRALSFVQNKSNGLSKLMELLSDNLAPLRSERERQEQENKLWQSGT